MLSLLMYCNVLASMEAAIAIAGIPKRADSAVRQQTAISSEQSGPIFVPEPPNEVQFSNSTGALIPCVGKGAPIPKISWENIDGSEVVDVPGLRHVCNDGSLLFPPFSPRQYSPSIHTTIYRCTAINAVGQIQSKDVQVKAVVNHQSPYKVKALQEFPIRSCHGALRPTIDTNITIVAGRQVVLRCPVVGYPIESLKWEHNGHILPINHRQKVEQLTGKGYGGHLRIENVQKPSDEGDYFCVAKGSKSSEKGVIHVTVKVAPLIDPQPLPERIFANEGLKVKLVCSVIQGDPPVEIKWYKEDVSLSSSRYVSLQNSEDYSLLTFKRIAYEDRGNYTCEAANEVDSVNRSSQLIVNVPPKWRIEPNNVFVVLGKKVLIDCSADGYPQPRIAWKKSLESTFAETGKGHPSEFRDILSSYRHQVYANGSFVVQEADKSDAGYYMCQVSNGVGAGLSKLVTLTVHIPPHFGTKFVSVSSLRGERSILRCEAHGDLPMLVTWQKDKQPLDPLSDKRYVIEEEKKNEKTIASHLQIVSTGRHDSALYTCEAKNQFGEDDTNIQLIVQEVPEAPTIVEIKDKTSRSVSVQWKTPYSGNSAITGYSLEYRNDSNDEFEPKWFTLKAKNQELKATINNLVPLTKYQVRVLAENSVGISEASQAVNFETSEEVPGGPPLDVQVEASGAQSLKVKWKPPKAELRYGKIRGYYIGYRVYDVDEAYNYKNIEVSSLDNGSNNDEVMSYITNLKRKSTYEIIVQAYNNAGTGPRSDEVRMTTLEAAPPTSPNLEIYSSTTNSVTLRWDSNQNDIDNGEYILYYKPESNPNWMKKEISSVNSQYKLSDLHCGTRYQFYMTATNSLGTGEPSETITGRTKGAAPVSPHKSDFIVANHSSAALYLVKWINGGCAIKSFGVKYKANHQKQWISFNKEIPPNQEKVVISHLIPGKSYSVVVNANSDAGTTEAEYEFKTLNKSIIPITVNSISTPKQVSSQTASAPLFGHFAVLLPVVISVLVLVIVLSILMFCIRRQNESVNANAIDRISNSSTHKSDLNQEGVALSDYQRSSCYGGAGGDPMANTAAKAKQIESYYSSPARKVSLSANPCGRQTRNSHDYAEPYSQNSRCVVDDNLQHSANCSSSLMQMVTARVNMPEGPYATIKRSPPRPSSFLLTSSNYPDLNLQ